MDWKLKKMIPTIAVSLVAFTSVLSAAGEEMQIRNLENRVSALETKKGAGGIINPAVNPYCKDAVDLFLRADVLWMSAREDGLEYAYTVTSANVAEEGVDVDAVNVDKKWKAGFRIGIGYYMSHDGWDLTLDWTSFSGKHDANVSTAGDDSGLPGLDYVQRRMGRFGTSIALTSADNFAEASAQWKMDLNLADLEMGRNFFVSKYLSLRPFVGLRFASINQKMDYSYDDPIDGKASFDSYDVHHKNDYSGFGLRLGLNGDWMMGKDWSFFGNAALSGLYGKFKIESHEWETSIDVDGDESVSAEIGHYTDDYYNGKAILDLALGLRWSHLFSQDRYGLTVQLAWEDHVFFNQNQLPVWLNDGDEFGGRTIEGHGDLSLQGLSLGLRFDF